MANSGVGEEKLNAGFQYKQLEQHEEAVAVRFLLLKAGPVGVDRVRCCHLRPLNRPHSPGHGARVRTSLL